MDGARIDAVVDLWVETSTDGMLWVRPDGLDSARETGRDGRELRALAASYTAVLSAMGARLDPPWPWFRLVMQGAESGTVLAVIPRRWSGSAYETTGGEWMVVDDALAYRAWCLTLVTTRLTTRMTARQDTSYANAS